MPTWWTVGNICASGTDAFVVQELTEDESMSEYLKERRNGSSGNDVTLEGEQEDDDSDVENAMTVTKAANNAQKVFDAL